MPNSTAHWPLGQGLEALAQWPHPTKALDLGHPRFEAAMCHWALALWASAHWSMAASNRPYRSASDLGPVASGSLWLPLAMAQGHWPSQSTGQRQLSLPLASVTVLRQQLIGPIGPISCCLMSGKPSCSKLQLGCRAVASTLAKA